MANLLHNLDAALQHQQVDRQPNPRIRQQRLPALLVQRCPDHIQVGDRVILGKACPDD